MEPNDLRACEQAELIEVVRRPVHFGDVPNVGLFVMKSLRQTYVEVGRQDRAHQPAQNQLGGRPIAGTNVLMQGGQIEERPLSVRVRLEEMLDNEREVLGKTIIAVNEPLVRLKPRCPLCCLDLFRKGLAAKFEVGKSLLGKPLHALGSKRYSDEKDAPAPNRKVGRASLAGCRREQRTATLSLCGIVRR